MNGVHIANKGGTVTSYLKDYHGNVVGYTDKSGGMIQDAYERMDYEAFGKQLNGSIPDPFGYCGEYYDIENGLVYLRNRYYGPTIGRFLTEDPIRDGLNWYAFCDNNPVMFVDPSGYITQKEMEMYEKGEMAPMAYSHLMNLTYQWYLADTEESKARYNQWAEDFRATGYTTTNGLFKNVDEGIIYMPSKPTDEITEEQHFFRNKLNLQFPWSTFEKLNERLPDDLKWKELPLGQSAFHKFGQINNRKYVSACEHFEAVYTKENYLVDEEFSAINMGTYNYYGPAQAQKHANIDVAPWSKWGNVPAGWLWSDLFY